MTDEEHPQFTIGRKGIESFSDTVTMFNEECKLRFNNDRMFVRVVDPANVAMVYTEVDSEAFDVYPEISDPPAILGINMKAMMDAIDNTSSNAIDLKYNQRIRKLAITADNITFKQGLIDPDSIRQEPDLPDLNLPATIEMTAETLDSLVSSADMVSDHISFEITPDHNLRIESEGDTDEIIAEYDDSDLPTLETDQTAIQSQLSIDYLTDLVNGIKSSGSADTVVKIKFGDEFPVKFTHSYASGHGNCTTIIAPRIQSN